MLEPLLGSINRERVLLFLYGRGEGYAREIARFYNTDLNQIQKQLERLEIGDVIYSRHFGKTRLYALNSHYPFLKELSTLLDKVLSFYPDEEKERLLKVMKKPGRKDKLL